jgi:ribosome-associated protein
MGAVTHDDEPSRRQLARKARRDDGDQSAKLAHALMAMSAAALRRLGLDDDLRAEVDRSRRITALAARRREERRLAGVIRRIDGDALAVRIAEVERGGAAADRRPFQQAETWRTRLLDGGPDDQAAFTAAHPTVESTRLAALVTDARRERTTGRPPGAARALFRTILTALSAAAEPAGDDAAEDAEDETDADGDADGDDADEDADADSDDED